MIEKKVNYISSKESRDEEEQYGGNHELHIYHPETGESISSLDFVYFGKPLPHYKIGSLETDMSFQDQKLASHIMEEIENRTKEKGYIAILFDAITETQGAFGMYERRGWISMGMYKIFSPKGEVSSEVINQLRKVYRVDIDEE